jgi:sugar lactone lactonase YvrE
MYRDNGLINPGLMDTQTGVYKMKNNFAFKLAVLLVILTTASLAARAQEYKYERSIGHAPTVGDPQGLVVDRAGNVYVADRINGAVIQIPAGVSKANAFQPIAKLERPVAIAIDRSGNLLVADESRGIVQRLSQEGAPLKTWSVRAEGRGSIGNPAGIAADSQGNFYVSDQTNNQVLKFDAGGKLVKTIGRTGSAAGEFLGPHGLATDSQGNLYVADEFNNRIEKFDANGNLIAVSDTKALGTTISQGLGPTSVAIDSKGNIWVAAHTNFSVYKLDPKFNIIVRLEAFGRRDGELAGPISVAIDSMDNVYCLDRSRRIQKFNSEGNFVSKFAFPAAKPGELSAPIGVLVDREGNLYVADDANFRIQKFDRNGRPVLNFGQFGNGDGEFNGVESISMDRFGNLYAVDSYNHRIQKFDNNGKFLAKWGSFGSRPGEFIRTKVVVVNPSPERDVVYVNDWHNARVQKFDLSGTYLGEFGNTGPQETRVLGPTGLAVDKAGNVYVSSWFNNAIQKFDSNGKFVASLGGPGVGNGQFKGPARLTMDADQNLVVVDWGNSRVQVLDTNGRFRTKFGSAGRIEGQFNQPVGVAVDSQGRLFVSDAANARVQVFTKKSGPIGLQNSKEKERNNAGHVFGQVAIYDVLEGKTREFEAALMSTREAMESEPAFINERGLRNVDELALQYATYAKFADRKTAERLLQLQTAKVRSFCRRDPEVHLAELTDSYFPEGISDHPTGIEFGAGLTGQIAHLGLFIPLPNYRQQYNDVLHDTKVLTRAKNPSGYIGEDLLVEAELTAPRAQSPYTPRASEPSKMSLNYGEYRTMENAEDSYISRQQSRDPKLVTMERTFFSSLQVPTRFLIFQVIANYSHATSASSRAENTKTTSK